MNEHEKLSMNSRRRRADDFTDSLRSFRQTFGAESTSIEHKPVSEMYSEDSLDAASVRKDTLIQSSNFTNEQHVSSSDTYHTAEENCDTDYNDTQLDLNSISNATSYMSLQLDLNKIDLNKCINLFHNKHLKREQEITPTETAVTSNSHEKVESTIIPSMNKLSQSLVLSNTKDDQLSVEEDQKYDSTSTGSTLEDIDFYELKTLLHSLESQKKSPREAPVQERTLRRLSEIFYVSPNDFTERLLTIIEESVVINDSDTREFPDVSLCRLTAELRKMCKFIDDETVPEWPASPNMSTSFCAGEDGQVEPDSSRRSLGTFPSPRKDLRITTPVASTSFVNRYSGKSPRRILRRTPKTISAALNNIQSPMYDSTNVHDSTTTFEYLEAYCKRLFPDEYKQSPSQKNHLQSPLQNMSSVLHTCDAQMKSLEDSPNICEPLRKIAMSTSDSASQYDKVSGGIQNFRHEFIILTPDKHKKTWSVERASMSSKQCARRSTRWEVLIEPDDLEKTLMYEIAKKRQRCLDTAKVIMEIEGNSEPLTAQKTCSISEARSSTEKDAKLMETLMSCRKYKEYLEEHKSLLNLLQRSESCKSRFAQSKKDVHTKKCNKVNVATLAVPKSTSRGKNSRSPSPKALVVSKPRLFVTPGKTSVNKTTCKEKRTYFPNLGVNSCKKEKLKKGSNLFSKISNVSPSTESICRRIGSNYDSVISPVGMYIKGTNPHLIKNLRPKTDEMLLTPRRKEPISSANTKPEMKFRLSPKQSKKTFTGTPAQDENVPDNFLHPKVRYKLPSHVRTIKETGNRKAGNRINELLRSTQDKVVIRHEGRTKTVQTNCLEQPEIHYDSAEESVHIEQTARKTHFSRVQKDH